MNYRQAICVGGPVNGRIVAMPDFARGMEFPELPGAWAVLKADLIEDEHEERFHIRSHHYRWERAKVAWGFAEFAAIAIVHEDIKDRNEINRVILAAAIGVAMLASGELVKS